MEHHHADQETFINVTMYPESPCLLCYKFILGYVIEGLARAIRDGGCRLRGTALVLVSAGPPLLACLQYTIVINEMILGWVVWMNILYCTGQLAAYTFELLGLAILYCFLNAM